MKTITSRHGDVRQRILDAAKQRLWHYGFKKTTMDEIASDAGVGKGTVYLYFDSKEDIGLAIIGQYKEESLHAIQDIAEDAGKTPVQKLKEMLQHSLLMAHRKCLESPQMLEMVIAVKPHIRAHIQTYMDTEHDLLAGVLAEGNHRGEFDVPDTLGAARTLKMMTHGFMPPYPYVSTQEEIAAEIAEIVDLAVRGLRKV